MTAGAQRSRTILVTGTSSGIGAALRAQLLADGHTVVGVARRPQEPGPGFVPVALDLADLDAVAGALAPLLERFPELDGVVSNAAMPAFGPLEELAPATIERAIAVGLTSHLLVVRALLPQLRRLGRGDIVLVGSESAFTPRREGTADRAAKFGLRGFAGALRDEVRGAGVRVGVVHPGAVRTPWFEGLDFAPGDAPEDALQATDVVGAIVAMLSAGAGCRVEEIVLAPLRQRYRRRAGDER